MSQTHYSPHSNQFSPLWSVTKAGAFMDAVDQATKSRRQAARTQQKAATSEPAPSQDFRPRQLPFGLTPQRLAAALALILISGLTAASWIV